MGHPLRLMIIGSLKSGELTVGDLAQRLDLSLAQVSQHLKVMEKVELVRGRREGRHIYYSIAAPMVSEICMAICHQMEFDLERSQAEREVFEELRARLRG